VGIDPGATDTGINGQALTFADRITSDTNTGFVGTAEADAIVEMWADGDPISTSVIDASDFFQGLTVALPRDGNQAFELGQWNLAGQHDLNDPDAGFPLDGVRQIGVTATDVAGNQSQPDFLDIFVDTQGPRVYDPVGGLRAVHIADDAQTPEDEASYDLFFRKGDEGKHSPTPLVRSLVVHVEDLPARAENGFLYEALLKNIAETPGYYSLVGDYSGAISIQEVLVENATVQAGQRATATITLTFEEPLPDDRYTLSISDGLMDRAGNAFDGESHSSEPQATPQFPSGDGVPGEDFVARFTVDSRPEVVTYAAGSVWADTNGNTSFDPDNVDHTNRDLVYRFGHTSDDLLLGNFVAGAREGADGFDKLAAYGREGGQFRWLVDTDNDGVPNDLNGSGAPDIVDPMQLNGLPVAGNFDGDKDKSDDVNGDEVGLYVAEPSGGSIWYFDTNHTYTVNQTSRLESDLHGQPFVGDFNGDHFDDLGSWENGVFQIDLYNKSQGGWDGKADWEVSFDFIGVREQPVVADFDQDGIDDLGLWTPDRSGVLPEEGSEWYFIVSHGSSLYDRININPGGAQNPATGKFEFTPDPFGPDQFIQYGNEYSMPLFGNLDPPVTGQSTASSSELVIEGTGGDDVFLFQMSADGDSWTVFANGVEQDIPDGTESIIFAGGGGTDVAFLRGSEGEDWFSASPSGANLNGIVSTRDIEVIHGYGMGGDDQATLYDSSGNDNFKAKQEANYAKMNGKGYYLRAKFFEDVTGVFTEGDDDYARIWDTSGADQLSATPTDLTLSGGKFRASVEAYDRLLAYSTFGGSDEANLLDSPGDDTMRARSHKTTFWGPGFDMTLRGWEDVTARSANGGTDVAKLHDTQGDDVVLVGDEWGSLSSKSGEELDLLYAAYGFERVKAYHSAGEDEAPDPKTVDFLLLDDEASWNLRQ
jgi:hypothetical protein